MPNRGLDLRCLRTLLRDQKNACFISKLSEDSDFFGSAYGHFVRALESDLKDCQVVSFFETRDTRAVVTHSDGSWRTGSQMIRVVTKEAAAHGPPSEAIQVAIDADHATMVKFSNSGDQQYVAVRKLLSECVNNISRKVQCRQIDRPIERPRLSRKEQENPQEPSSYTTNDDSNVTTNIHGIAGNSQTYTNSKHNQFQGSKIRGDLYFGSRTCSARRWSSYWLTYAIPTRRYDRIQYPRTWYYGTHTNRRSLGKVL